MIMHGLANPKLKENDNEPLGPITFGAVTILRKHYAAQSLFLD